MDLDKEAKKATELLKNKIVDVVFRHRTSEVCILFTDGTSLFVNQVSNGEGIELSITGDESL